MVSVVAVPPQRKFTNSERQLRQNSSVVDWKRAAALSCEFA
jgi:hypothetical protein